MENIIRDGELRLLTSETSCDVILSCRGRKLSAHKLILSIASPVLQELLLHDSADPTVLIFPDVNGNTMSLILEYIYNGSVIISAYNLPEFLSTATFLKLHLDYDGLDKNKHIIKTDFSTNKVASFEEKPSSNYLESIKDLTKEIPFKRSLRKIPNLMPISSVQKSSVVTVRRGLYNRVFPSPWCPRVTPLLADPREDYSVTSENLITSQSTKDNSIEENDTNNNFQIRSINSSYLTNAIINNHHTYSGKKDTFISHHRTNATVAPTLRYPPVDSSSSSPVHTEAEDEQKFQLSEKSPTVTCKREGKHSNQETTATQRLKDDLKTGGKENLSSPRSSETDEEVIKNESTPEKQKPFKCQDCGKSFSQLRNYKYHRSIHEGTKEFAARCPECGKVFNDRGYLSSHLKIHRDRKEYACPSCPKRFNQRVAYNMHLRIHTGVKPHECPTCGKTFSRKMLLKQHQRVHTGERPYSCPECGKSFADRSNMSLHARLHTGVKPYACNLCPKSFTKKHHLKTHMNFHTGLKPYSCQKCGLAFSQSSNMRTHYKKCILKSPSTSISSNS